MHALYDTFLRLQKKVEEEMKARLEIQLSDRFLALNAKIEAAKAEQALLLDGIPDSSQELINAKETLMQAMRSQNLSSIGNARAKYREKREVNREKVLTVIGGDMDLYLSLSTISQVNLKDFAKKSPLKNELLDCIEVTEKELIDLEIVPEHTAS